MSDMSHCIAVAAAMGPVNDRARLAALLHDSVEDGDAMFEQLTLLLPPYELQAVAIVTRAEGESYEQYIDSVAHSGNRLAVQIKRADLRVNLARCAGIPKYASLEARYRAALRVLDDAELASEEGGA